MHTHEADGTIHVEGAKDRTIGHFMALIRGVEFGRYRLGPYRAKGSDTVRMWVKAPTVPAFKEVPADPSLRLEDGHEMRRCFGPPSQTPIKTCLALKGLGAALVGRIVLGGDVRCPRVRGLPSSARPVSEHGCPINHARTILSGSLACAIYAGIAMAGGSVDALGAADCTHGTAAIWRHKPLALALALLSVAVTLASGPIDNAWHIAFGRDSVIWSAPHILGIAARWRWERPSLPSSPVDPSAGRDR